MAASQADLLSLGAVFAILLGMVFFNAYMSHRPAPRRTEDETGPDPSFLCKFVTHEGSVVGETVALDGDQAILKQAGVFKAVPVAALRPDGGELQLVGHIDWTAAEAGGQAWQERVKGEGVAEVAGELTKSSDVRAPALEAFRKRHGLDDGEEE